MLISKNPSIKVYAVTHKKTPEALAHFEPTYCSHLILSPNRLEAATTAAATDRHK